MLGLGHLIFPGYPAFGWVVFSWALNNQGLRTLTLGPSQVDQPGLP